MKSIVIADFGNTGGEADALRQAAEYFGYFVVKYNIGRPRDFIRILQGEIDVPLDILVISGHGKDSKIIMPILGESVYYADEPRVNFSSKEITNYLNLNNTCIINLCCSTGSTDMQNSFLINNNVYIAPIDYVEGSASLLFVIMLLYQGLQNGFNIKEAYERAKAIDSETSMFVLKEHPSYKSRI